MFWILVSILIATFTYFMLIRPFTYWSNSGVPHCKFWVIWTEFFLAIIGRRSITEVVEKYYNKFPGKRYCGVYVLFMRGMFLRDPALIKQISVKDFDHFTDHYQMLAEGSQPVWEKTLLFLKGEKWREMRSAVTPCFTGSKMKMMFGLMSECAKQFVEYFQEKNLEVVTVEMKDVFVRFTADVIATTAFGIKSNSLKDPESEFYLMAKKLTDMNGILSNIKLLIIFAAPKLSQLLGLKVFKDKVINYFRNIIKDNLETREKHGIVRHDMIHMLMEARIGNKSEKQNEEKSQNQKLSEDDIMAHSLTFFFAGFHSVSTMLSFMAYELAVNPDVQQKLQQEVDEALKNCGGVITYDALMDMKYMDMVTSETLRKWPFGSAIVDRMCVKPYTIESVEPGEEPIYLKKGDRIWLPAFGLHRDPQYYHEPERFDPERFSDENKSNIIPYTYLPFGSGPRTCIGNRFALMETKVAFCYILSQFEITVVEKTTVPLKVAKSLIELSSEGGFWLGLKKRKI